MNKNIFISLGLIVSLFAFSNFAIAAPTSKHTKVNTVKHQLNQNLVNINKANIGQLSTLKGVSKRRAQAIINFREKNGKFKSIEDLTDIRGIGEKFIDANKERLTVS